MTETDTIRQRVETLARRMDDHAMQQLEADYAHTLRALLTRAEKAEAEKEALTMALDIVVNEPQKAKIKRLTAERDTAWNDAIDAAIDEVHQECWTDGDGGPATEVLLAEQATTSLAIRAIRALRKGEPT